MRPYLATALFLIALAPASAQAARRSHAVTKVEQLQKGKGVKTGHELTPALAQLAAELPKLGSADRGKAESLLSRPDDTQKDPSDTHKWLVPEAAPFSPACGTHFCVHWVAASGDAPSLTDTSPANSVPDYVDQMLSILENEVYPCENGTAAAACAGLPGLGWRDAAPDGTRGNGGNTANNNKTDVYIEDLYANERVFGYVATDPGQPQDPSVPHYAYMVLDKDYSRFANGDPAGGVAAEQVTAAHEYNHILQNAYDYLEDSWMFEATAVYVEDKVYPQINDYLHYVPAWTANTRQPLTTFSQGNLKPYGSAVWNHWLDFRFGRASVRAAWESSVAAADFAPGAYSAAITGAGGAGFPDEFSRFSAAAAEWNVPGSGFPDPYPDVPRDGLLPAGTQTNPFTLAHTTFALFDVPIPATAPVLRLTASLPAGVAGGIALVGRTGPDPAAGTVTSNLTSIPTGGVAAVQLDNPGAFGRITAVVVNGDPSRAGFDQAADDYVFTKDAQNVVAAVTEPGAPVAVTGTAGPIADHKATVGGAVDPHLLDTTWTVEYGRTAGYGSTTAPQPLPGSTLGAATVSAPLAELKANATYHYRVVASNPAGVAPGRDMTFKTTRDVTRPVVTLKVRRQKLRTARTRGALYLLRCSERCLGTAQLRLTRAAAKRLGLPVVIARTRVTLDQRPRAKALRVRLTPRAKRALAGRRTALRATLRLALADESRNGATSSKRVEFQP